MTPLCRDGLYFYRIDAVEMALESDDRWGVDPCRHCLEDFYRSCVAAANPLPRTFEPEALSQAWEGWYAQQLCDSER